MFTIWCNFHYRDIQAASLAVQSKITFALHTEHKMVYNRVLPKMTSTSRHYILQSITLTLNFYYLQQ